jgi:hypothetical protein
MLDPDSDTGRSHAAFVAVDEAMWTLDRVIHHYDERFATLEAVLAAARAVVKAKAEYDRLTDIAMGTEGTSQIAH